LFGVSAPTSPLLAGTNVLAIEIHQTSPTSTDLTMDASLECDAFVPYLGPCAAGNAGPSGTPAAVFLLNGSTGGAARSIDLASTAPLVLAMVPPPGASSAHFALFGVVGTPGPQGAFTLPEPIGTMCFTPSVIAPGPGSFLVASSFFPDPLALLPATAAPWGFTVTGGAPAGATFALQGVITDALGVLRTTNAIRINVVP
jgi:hypothetical protein